MAKNFGFFFISLLFTLPLSVPASRAQKGVVGTELWCVAKNNADDAALQSALDWACGPGATDCGPIQQGGPCYDPTDIQSMASFAFNDYYLKHGTTDDSCFFDNTAALTSLNPSECPHYFLLFFSILSMEMLGVFFSWFSLLLDLILVNPFVSFHSL
jgi:hypothetical protein